MFKPHNTHSNPEMNLSRFDKASSLLQETLKSSLETNKFSDEIVQALSEAGITTVTPQDLERIMLAVMTSCTKTITEMLKKLAQEKTQNAGFAQNRVIEVIDTSEGFILLLLNVSSAEKGQKRVFIVGVTDEKATTMQQKSEVTALDFERDEIVRFFDKNECVTNNAISQSISHFRQHFIANAKMKAFNM
jgi:biotin synthase-related radical SAM superfamily protein